MREDGRVLHLPRRVRDALKLGFNLARGRVALVLTILALVAIHLAIEPMWFTGDEPRYASSGLALFTSGHLIPTSEVWQAFIARSMLPVKPYPYAIIATVRAQSLAPGALFGLPGLWFGLGAARSLNLAIACFGILVLAALLRHVDTGRVTIYGPRAAAIATVALSLPFIAYARLLYPEVLLFTTIALALYALTTKRFVVVSVAAGLMPLEHVRTLPLSLTFFCIAAYELVRASRERKATVRFVAIYGALIMMWCVIQINAYGSIFGPAFSTNAPSLATFGPRLAIALLDVRHGLLTYSPIFLIALAGIVAGSIEGNPLCRRSALLCIVYVGTFMWSFAGESWSGRFWVAALPMLAVGLAYGFARMSSLAMRLVALALAAITFTNTIVYVLHPMWYVFNRTRSITYDAVASYAHVTLGALLPIDDTASPVFPQSPLALLTIVAALLVMIVLWTRDAAREHTRSVES